MAMLEEIVLDVLRSEEFQANTGRVSIHTLSTETGLPYGRLLDGVLHRLRDRGLVDGGGGWWYVR